MEFRVEVQLVLHEACEMRAQDTCFMRGLPWSIVPDGWIFSQRYTHTNDLQNVSQSLSLW